MPIKVERIPNESIIKATINEPFDPPTDIPAMFAEFIPLRQTIQGPMALIVDLNETNSVPDAFGRIVIALAEAAKGIRASKEAQLGGPPILIFVGSGFMAELSADAVEQEQYGGTKAQLCTTLEEALALAREKLAT